MAGVRAAADATDIAYRYEVFQIARAGHRSANRAGMVFPSDGNTASSCTRLDPSLSDLCLCYRNNSGADEINHARSPIKAFGGPDTLELIEAAEPRAGADTALVRVEAASINPSDVKNVVGAMHQTALPRAPGRDYAGIVEQGPAGWIGATVWGTGGDVGFTRDGTHAELIVVPIASLRRKPKRLSFGEAASVGVNFVVAWSGLVEAAALAAGEMLVVIGAGGVVGGAAAQIAHRLGARVIGVDRNEPHPDAPIHTITERLIIGAGDLLAVVRTSAAFGRE